MTTKTIILKRVPYGKKNTLDEDKEYQLFTEGFAIGPVGTMKEWKKVYPDAEFKIIDEVKE
jgi:hypothetical protein